MNWDSAQFDLIQLAASFYLHKFSDCAFPRSAHLLAAPSQFWQHFLKKPVK
jgi:hypothetical protein